MNESRGGWATLVVAPGISERSGDPIAQGRYRPTSTIVRRALYRRDWERAPRRGDHRACELAPSALAIKACAHGGQTPCVRSVFMPARTAGASVCQSPATLRTRLHHAHSVTQIASSRWTLADAVTLASATWSADGYAPSGIEAFDVGLSVPAWASVRALRSSATGCGDEPSRFE
jgi:hypothetical protein